MNSNSLQNKVAISGIVLSLILIIFLAMFWSRLTPFYRDCIKIKRGMDEASAEAILKSYMNNDGYVFAREAPIWGAGLFVAKKGSSDQCSVSIRKGHVEAVEARFDP